MNIIKKLFAHTHYQKQEEKLLKSLFEENLKGKNLLDIGCGRGKYLHLLSSICSNVIGVDVNPTQVNKLRKEGFETYTPEDFPRDHKYDVILMSHIIEHFDTKGLIELIDTYLALLDEDGILIILTPMPGDRFWHDYTHVRPYTPQSLGMLFGILDGPAAFNRKQKMRLQNIWFFRDSWRIRNNRHYYPSEFIIQNNIKFRILEKVITALNIILAGLHAISNGRLGVISSWVGIYRKDAS